MNSSLKRVVTTPTMLSRLAEQLRIAELGDALVPDFAALLDTLPSGAYACPPGTEIVSEGDSDLDFYVLYSGKAGVWVSKNRAIPEQIAELAPGDFFGEIGFLMGTPRTASVRTSEETVVFRFEVDAFKRLLEKHPALDSRLRETARQRLRGIYLDSL
ncbi:MAG: cyclic nucleotide-binding domain-containing protein [Elusimicrobia bacterium]|nr:cyclic nucleotide-binding domain-containing protein [Elusimicrobiota bacterium]